MLSVKLKAGWIRRVFCVVIHRNGIFFGGLRQKTPNPPYHWTPAYSGVKFMFIELDANGETIMHTDTSTQTQNLQKVADELIHFLADTYAVYLKTQNFHWNVKGPLFFSLHKMFEEQYQELANAVDEIAERIRALGSLAPASFSQFAKLSSIKEEMLDISAEDMVKKLLHDHETMSKQCANVIAKAQQAHDESTIDLLIQRMKAHDKMAWMLRSSSK